MAIRESLSGWPWGVRKDIAPAASTVYDLASMGFSSRHALYVEQVGPQTLQRLRAGTATEETK